MSISTCTSREFNQDVSKIKKATSQGPVFITDRGRPAHVLLSIDEYLKLTASKKDIVHLLAMPESKNLDFKVPKLQGKLFNSKEFD